MGGVKNKIMNHFKTNATNDYNKPKHVKNLYGGKKTKNERTTQRQHNKRQNK